MLRKALRAGIRDVAQGIDPKGVFRHLDGPLATYAHSTVEALEQPFGAVDDATCLKAYSKQTIDQILPQ